MIVEKNVIQLVTLLLVFYSCKGGNKTGLGFQQTEQIDSITTKYEIELVNEYEYSISSNDSLSFDLSNEMSVKKDDKGSVIISTLNNKKVKFNAINSSYDETENVRYEYLGKLSIGYYIIKALLWESMECYLVNINTGQIDTIWNVPTVSKKGTYLLAKSLDFGLEDVPNGIQIFKCEANVLVKLAEINQSEWIPLDIRWASENSFIVRAATIKSYFKQKKEIIYYKITLKD